MVAARQRSSNAVRPRGLRFRCAGDHQHPVRVRLIEGEETQETGEESR